MISKEHSDSELPSIRVTLMFLVDNDFKLIKPLKWIGFSNFCHSNFESNLQSSTEYN